MDALDLAFGNWDLVFPMFENLLLAREAAVAVVTINRPQVLNALNAQTLDELKGR